VNATLNALKKSGSRVISTGGRPVHMMAAVQDPNNIFLILQQGP
jgi:hypothetical protein